MRRKLLPPEEEEGPDDPGVEFAPMMPRVEAGPGWPWGMLARYLSVSPSFRRRRGEIAMED